MLSWRHPCRRVHPLRAIGAILNEALGELSPSFAKLYARPAIDHAQADALLVVAAGLLFAPNAGASGRIVWTVPGPSAPNMEYGRAEHQRPPAAIDRRTTGHGSYAHSQRARKIIEEAFGYIKTIAGQARTELRGLAQGRWTPPFAVEAHTLICLPKLIETTPCRSAPGGSLGVPRSPPEAISGHPIYLSEPVQDHPRRPIALAGQFFNDLLELRERIPDPATAPAY
jgi:hypothetical protein